MTGRRKRELQVPPVVFQAYLMGLPQGVLTCCFMIEVSLHQM